MAIKLTNEILIYDPKQKQNGRPADVKVGQLKSFKNKYLE